MQTILHVAAFPFPVPQGSQVYVAGLAAAQVRAGDRVILACYGPRGGVFDGVDVRVPRCRVAPHRTTSGPHWSRVPNNIALAWEVRRILKEEDVDVIHAHNVEAPLICWMATRRRPPVIYTLHTQMKDELPTYVDFAKGFWRRVGALFDGLAARASDAGMAISDDAARVLSDLGVRKVGVVRPGINMAEFADADGGAFAEKWELGSRAWVVYVGNADPYQDLDDLFAAIAISTRLHLLIVTGSDVSKWQRRARRLGIAPSRLRWVRSAAWSDHKNALAAGAVGVVPRRICAGFPVKLLNMLAAGLPVVVAEGSAQPIDGLVVVPNGQHREMAIALEQLAEDEERRKHLARRSRESVLANWGWDCRVSELRAFYTTLAHGSVSSSGRRRTP